MSARPLCVECSLGRHSACSGDFSSVIAGTCWCGFCKAWLDEHGPFSTPPDARGADTPRDAK